LQQFYTIDDAQYSVLYSIYSWPNTVQVFFGGFIIDKYLGIRKGALVFGTLVLLGQAVWAVSAFNESYVLAVIGRFVFGLGGETLGVCQSIYTAR
jgi:MFS family permease